MTSPDKAAGRARVSQLVTRFQQHAADYVSTSYNETQARTDFITPLLEAFGWDVHNNRALPSALREVVEEATVEVGEERLSKKPDYELRLGRQRRMFVEAKKPSVRIDRERAPAFQVRRYGFSASLPVAVLTNFQQFAVYDCIPKPSESDEPYVARTLLLEYGEFEERFDELWDLLSRETVYSGAFDERFAVGVTRRGAEQFDDYFLAQVRGWRERLAVDINANTPNLTASELTYAVQLFLSRIVFLRICEDRDLEKYETLREVTGGSTYTALVSLLKRADAFYDSGLFRLIDDERLRLRISDEVLNGIISELYYPYSPYTFAAVETGVLGEIYEQFLGEEISVIDGSVAIDVKPEVRAGGGVVPTPRYVANAIVDRTVSPALIGRAPEEIADLSVLDPCCGSGSLLISAYERLLEHYLDWYVADGTGKHAGRTIYEVQAGRWKLTLEERRRILVAHIFGVDIDPNAVDVARFSLFLKLIEDSTGEDLADSVRRSGRPVLPALERNIRCGNSLVSADEWQPLCGRMDQVLGDKVRPLTWKDEFPAVFEAGGFDLIVENPPYVRIQNMVAYSPEEVGYYRHPESPYSTASQDNFDKYALFIERSLSLLKATGKIGAIVPNKFMNIRSGRALRRLLSAGNHVDEVVHFGAKQVFGPQTSNYTCILALSRTGSVRDIRFEKVASLDKWRCGEPGALSYLPRTELSTEAWQFSLGAARDLFERIRRAFSETLEDVADIFVGLQTSADEVYIVRAEAETSDEVVVEWNGMEWPIEKGLLRPCLHDVPLHAFSQPAASSWMIFPYELGRDARGRTTARLIQPDQLFARFPGGFAYLDARRQELVGRSVTGGVAAERQWYQYGRSQSLNKFGVPKVVLPVLSTEARYAYDATNAMVTGGGNGPYYLLRPKEAQPVSIFYILAVLNHPVSEAMVRMNTSPFRGGYYSHGKQFIGGLPIPIPNSEVMATIDRLVADLIRATSEASESRTPEERALKEREVVRVRRDVEACVSEVFGLSDADLETARAVPIPD